jgi:hypothetical protein
MYCVAERELLHGSSFSSLRDREPSSSCLGASEWPLPNVYPASASLLFDYWHTSCANCVQIIWALTILALDQTHLVSNCALDSYVTTCHSTPVLRPHPRDTNAHHPPPSVGAYSKFASKPSSLARQNGSYREKEGNLACIGYRDRDNS